MPAHALAILTHVPADSPVELRDRLPAAVESLKTTDYPGPVIVVDDGSTDGAHLRRLETLPPQYRLIRRPRAGGICRAKNTCLRALREAGAEIGFLAEDDILFRPGWHQRYLAAHAATDIHHFSWAWDDDPSGLMRKTLRHIHGHPVVRTSRVNGALLTFTRHMLETIGGFRILPARWGHTHTNWTRRAIGAGLAPWFADIADSNRYIGMGPAGHISAISPTEKQHAATRNEAPAADLTRLHFPLEE